MEVGLKQEPAWHSAPPPSRPRRTPGAPGGCVSASPTRSSAPSRSASTGTGTAPAASSGQQGAGRLGTPCIHPAPRTTPAHLPLPQRGLPEQEVGCLRGQWWRWCRRRGLVTGRVPALAAARWLHWSFPPGLQARVCGHTQAPMSGLWGPGYAADAAGYKFLNAQPLSVHLSLGELGGQRTS